jgi:hypothetical protein
MCYPRENKRHHRGREYLIRSLSILHATIEHGHNLKQIQIGLMLKLSWPFKVLYQLVS